MGQDSFPTRLVRNSRRWWRKHRDSLVLFFGVLTVGVLGFEAGFIQGMSKQQDPLRIELAPEEAMMSTETRESAPVMETGGQRIGQLLAGPSQENCSFVASRNSTLFHAATCAVVKRIKQENKLCFKDAGEAEARGLKRGCLK
ncbi:MAG: hypothetical protein KA054_02750 [Candidatus Moranbacteria bacterium]|nr:hypothetical protein [Candidatus Moranbacteria bacterium]